MSEIRCRHCGESNYRLNGKQDIDKQRYYCKSCGRNFSFSKPKEEVPLSIEQVLVILFYSTGRASYRHLAKVFGVCPATIMKWVKRYGETIAEPEISSDIEHIEIDEMWHFLGKKKKNYGSLKPLIETLEGLLHGLQASGMLQQFKDSIIN